LRGFRNGYILSSSATLHSGYDRPPPRSTQADCELEDSINVRWSPSPRSIGCSRGCGRGTRVFADVDQPSCPGEFPRYNWEAERVEGSRRISSITFRRFASAQTGRLLSSVSFSRALLPIILSVYPRPSTILEVRTRHHPWRY
jgi:hypothetical protein